MISSDGTPRNGNLSVLTRCEDTHTETRVDITQIHHNISSYSKWK
jgi:hypothetical protein